MNDAKRPQLWRRAWILDLTQFFINGDYKSQRLILVYFF